MALTNFKISKILNNLMAIFLKRLYLSAIQEMLGDQSLRGYLKTSIIVIVLFSVSVPSVRSYVIAQNWTSPTTQTLRSVSMVSTNDGWAVGDGGTIIRWNGTQWNTITGPTNENLYSMSMVNASDAWAVGSNGTIIRWNGAEWIPEFSTVILIPVLISLTLVAAILAKTTSKKLKRPSFPTETYH